MNNPRYAEIVCNNPLSRSLTYRIPEGIECSVGKRVTVPLGSRTVTGFVISVGDQAPGGSFTVREIGRVVDSNPVFGEQEIILARWMSELYLCSLGEALSVMLPGGRRDAAVPGLDTDDEIAPEPRNLSEAQRLAVKAVTSRKEQMYYLFGVTGSGKTEVFLQAAEYAVSRGEPVIYLVPEISLSHQLAREVMHRFRGAVAVLHSGMTPSQRLREWNRIRNGEVSLVIGARSAVFAPFEKPGLIIIDEEHESSYKSGSHPRYHARQIALKRIQDAGGTLVMGSATPSLESWKLMEDQRMVRLNLAQRISGGIMPVMKVVNLAEQPGPISQLLRDEIHGVLARGKQAILFLNRRGFSYFFHCRSCGYEMQCPHCSVSLTYHRSGRTMRCHYCGYVHPPVSVCPDCRSLDVGYSGFGTEMIEQEVSRIFPQAKVLRIDTDAVKEKQYLQKSLDQVRTGAVDILLGTQMVAKGLNFPNVELVGIVLADSSLHLPDFRAQERTFSLLTQVAGRAGRYSGSGRVIVQTYHPDNPAIQCALSQDLEGFYQQELEIRLQLAFPPFRRLCRIVLRGRNQKRTEETARQAEQLLAQQNLREVEVLGPSPCPIERIARNWREQILLRSNRLPPLVKAAKLVKEGFSSVSGVYVEIDIDPLSLM